MFVLFILFSMAIFSSTPWKITIYICHNMIFIICVILHTWQISYIKAWQFWYKHHGKFEYAFATEILIFFVLFITYCIFWSYLRFLYTTWKNSYCIWSFLIIFTPWQKYKHGGGSRKSILRRISSTSCMKPPPDAILFSWVSPLQRCRHGRPRLSTCLQSAH